MVGCHLSVTVGCFWLVHWK